MQENFLVQRLREFSCLNDREIDLMRSIGGPPIHLPRQSVIRSEGCRDRAAFMLLDGWVASSFTVQSGKQSISKIHLPGDLLGSTSLCVDITIDTLTALTPVTFRRVSLETIGMLLSTSPRIAAFLFLSAEKERIALMDGQSLIAHSGPISRLAAFLLDINRRLAAIGQSENDSFLLPMTQEKVGELLGFTPVHANRVFRELEHGRLIERDKRDVKLLDVGRLRALAGIPARETSTDLHWFNPTELW